MFKNAILVICCTLEQKQDKKKILSSFLQSLHWADQQFVFYGFVIS